MLPETRKKSFFWIPLARLFDHPLLSRDRAWHSSCNAGGATPSCIGGWGEHNSPYVFAARMAGLPLSCSSTSTGLIKRRNDPHECQRTFRRRVTMTLEVN